MTVQQVGTLVKFVLNGGQVRRFHTWPLIKDNNLAEHQFGVAWWLIIMYEFKPSADLLLTALSHDLSEYDTGDLPAQVKLAPAMNEAMEELERRSMDTAGVPRPVLTAQERNALMFADKLDGIACMIRERRLGSRVTQVVVDRTEIYLTKMLKETWTTETTVRTNAMKLLNNLTAEWLEAGEDR